MSAVVHHHSMRVGAVGPTAALTPDQIRARVAAVPFWWHQIDLGHGIRTPGKVDPSVRLPRLQIPDRLEGQSVLDIGAWDGFFSFECERRGARRVVAADRWDPTTGGATSAGFDTAREVLTSRVEKFQAGVYRLNDKMPGTFDLVLFLGVLYHLEDPLGALRAVRRVTKPGGTMILETLTDMLWTRRPCCAFYPGRDHRDEPTNWFAPNNAGLVGMCEAAGFTDVRIVWKLSLPGRVARAVREAREFGTSPLRGMAAGRAILHARAPLAVN